MPGDGEDGYLDPRVLFLTGNHAVQVRARPALLDPFLKMGRWVAHQRVELPKRDMLLVALPILARPVGGLAKEFLIRRHAAGQREPLDVITPEDVVGRR